jgi:hypothetical protein
MRKRTRKSDEVIRAEGVTPELFEKMVEQHDPTYLWSNDQGHIEKELDREREIAKARDILGDETAVPIWNNLMKRKVVPSFIEDHLWYNRTLVGTK